MKQELGFFEEQLSNAVADDIMRDVSEWVSECQMYNSFFVEQQESLH